MGSSASLEALASLNLGWQAPAAWSVAALCAVLAGKRLRRTKVLGPPELETLLADLLGQAGVSARSLAEREQRVAIAELNQRLADVSFELGLLPARFTALTRINLASGMALALFSYIGSTGRPAIERVAGLAACASAGLVGAALVLFVGRAAKQLASQIREAWDRSSREAGKTLGTSLASAASSTASARRA